MQIFNNFAELHAASNTSPVNNYYGDGENEKPWIPEWSKVMVSFTTQQLKDKLAEYNSSGHDAFEQLKADTPMEIDVEMGATDAKSGEFGVLAGKINMHTGELTVDGTTVGVLPTSPVDIVLATLDSGSDQVVRAIEHEIWKFINKNPSKFDNWRYE